jgi:hypothetical protein
MPYLLTAFAYMTFCSKFLWRTQYSLLSVFEGFVFQLFFIIGLKVFSQFLFNWKLKVVENFST